MSDVTLSYKGSDILELSDSGSATLKTGGKYCEDDIAVEYVKPSGGDDTPKAWTLANTVTIESGISSLSISLPSGYTEYALKLNWTLSASSKVNIYHTSVASSRLMGETNTSATQSDVVLVFRELQATTVDGISVLARTTWSASTAWGSNVVRYAMPTSILFTPSSSGVTWSSGTVKVYGR